MIIVYRAAWTRGELAVDDENSEIRTFAAADLPWNDLAFRSTREALRDYLRPASSARLDAALLRPDGVRARPSGLPCVLASAPSSAAAPRAMSAVSLPFWKQVKSGRSRHANGPHSRTPAASAASCTMLMTRS